MKRKYIICIWFEKYGLYRTDLTIASDYEAMLRYIHKYGIKLAYLPEVLVKMRLGGASKQKYKESDYNYD